MTRRYLAIAAVLALAGPPALAAQTATDLVGMGVRAYQDLDYETAALVLRRSLASAADDTLAASARLEALMYLGATELFRTRRDSAFAAFRRLVQLDPRYRPNELIFPPQVADLFREVRRATPALVVDVPQETELRIPAERFTARLEASAPHDVTITIRREDGTFLRLLYKGAITDSLVVAWDGLTERGAMLDDGRYQLRATSAALSGPVQRVVQVPLEIAQMPADTAPPPPAPERTPPAPPMPGLSIRPLAGGVLAGLAVILLPAVVASDANASNARFGVAAAIGVSGLVAYLRHQPPGPPVATYARPAQAARADRSPPARTARLRIRAGRPTVVDQETP
jgi:hypothetical protein